MMADNPHYPVHVTVCDPVHVTVCERPRCEKPATYQVLLPLLSVRVCDHHAAAALRANLRVVPLPAAQRGHNIPPEAQ